jgi:K+-transporting ATPase A subunit
VFIGGLMVGTTPEFLQKRLHARHMRWRPRGGVKVV